MKSYFEILKQHIEQNPPNFGEADSVLEMLYDCHNERNPYDNDQSQSRLQYVVPADAWHAAKGNGQDNLHSLHPLP